MTKIDLEYAVDAVARDIVAKALQAALDHENIGWEDYPDITEADYERAFDLAERLTKSWRHSEDSYEKAYGFLSARAENGEARP